MADGASFSFGSGSVAGGYDGVLVPVLFGPWASRLREELDDWSGMTVLDLATGTGVVAQALVDWVGPEGRVVASDVNAAMLELARRRCEGARPAVRFVEGPAHPLDLPDDSIDAVVCQQGFQFFPDRAAAAREVARVLRGGGAAVVSTWRPVAECELFAWICEALESVGESEISGAMRAPFDFLPEEELEAVFREAGFREVRVSRRSHPLVCEGGAARAVPIAYATPIGPRLRELSEAAQGAFREALRARAESGCPDGSTLGRMTANLLTARA